MTAKLHDDDDTIKVFGPINRQEDKGQSIRCFFLAASPVTAKPQEALGFFLFFSLTSWQTIEIMLTFRWFTPLSNSHFANGGFFRSPRWRCRRIGLVVERRLSTNSRSLALAQVFTWTSYAAQVESYPSDIMTLSSVHGLSLEDCRTDGVTVIARDYMVDHDYRALGRDQRASGHGYFTRTGIRSDAFAWSFMCHAFSLALPLLRPDHVLSVWHNECNSDLLAPRWTRRFICPYVLSVFPMRPVLHERNAAGDVSVDGNVLACFRFTSIWNLLANFILLITIFVSYNCYLPS